MGAIMMCFEEQIDSIKCGTYRQFGERYAVRVVVMLGDEDGPEITEIKWFSYEAEARAECGLPIRDMFEVA
jgi:hypothetical protein